MLTKFYAGCYRTTFAANLCTAYGHIRRVKSLWQANIHDAETGKLLRPAGLWDTLKEARVECNHLLWRDFRRTDAEAFAKTLADVRGV